MTNGLCIEVEMTDNGNLITEQKHKECFVTQFTVKNKLQAIQEALGGRICIDHACLPQVSSVTRNGLITINIECCCQNQLDNVSRYFDGKE